MTNIEWVRNPDGSQGITVNSKTGCLNHDDGLCKGGNFPCYAYKLAHHRLRGIYLSNTTTIASYQIDDLPINVMQKQVKAEVDPFYPRFWPDRLASIEGIQKPTGIFLDDMSDWMGEYWPKEWTEKELQVMRNHPEHRFYTLTKQPQELPAWSPFPDNAWVGVTATNAKMADDAGYYLQRIDAKVRFLSLEPLLESMQLLFSNLVFNRLDWLVIGACTGTYSNMERLLGMTRLERDYSRLKPYGNLHTVQPKLEWVSDIVAPADKAGVKVFLKNNLFPLIHEDASSGQYALDTGLLTWDGALRQEMPQ